MMLIEKIIFILYFFFFKNYMDLYHINFFFKAHLYNFIFYILVIFYIYLYYRLTFFNLKFIKIINNNNYNLYFLNKKRLYISVTIFILYITYYIIYLRFFSVVINKIVNINFFIFKDEKILYFKLLDGSSVCLNIFLSMTALFTIYIILFFSTSVIVFFSKKQFLKLHYYYFLRFSIYRNFLDKNLKLEFIILDFLKSNYRYYVFFKFYFCKLLLIFFFTKSFIINSGDLISLFNFIPYYSLLSLLININNYILYTIKYDFDILIMEQYYKDIFFFMEKNEFKKIEYIKNLLFNDSIFSFKDCILFFYKTKLLNTDLIINIYKYTINSNENCFFIRIKKVKPKIV